MLLWSIESFAIEVTGTRIVEYGRYIVNFMEGRFLGISHIKTTNRIPGLLGSMMGIDYVIDGKPKGQKVKIVIKLLHPPTKNPQSKTATTESEQPLEQEIGKIQSIRFELGEKWEVVPGKWTIQIFYENRKLGEKIFTVYKP